MMVLESGIDKLLSTADERASQSYSARAHQRYGARAIARALLTEVVASLETLQRRDVLQIAFTQALSNESTWLVQTNLTSEQPYLIDSIDDRILSQLRGAVHEAGNFGAIRLAMGSRHRPFGKELPLRSDDEVSLVVVPVRQLATLEPASEKSGQGFLAFVCVSQPLDVLPTLMETVARASNTLNDRVRSSRSSMPLSGYLAPSIDFAYQARLAEAHFAKGLDNFLSIFNGEATDESIVRLLVPTEDVHGVSGTDAATDPSSDEAAWQSLAKLWHSKREDIAADLRKTVQSWGLRNVHFELSPILDKPFKSPKTTHSWLALNICMRNSVLVTASADLSSFVKAITRFSDEVATWRHRNMYLVIYVPADRVAVLSGLVDASARDRIVVKAIPV